MKISFMPLLLLAATLLSVVSADPKKYDDCTFEKIMDKCGSIYLESIDDKVYGQRSLDGYDVNVVSPVRKFWEKLNDPNSNAEGKNNKDVAISYAFMHYVCFEPLIAPGEETKIYKCMLDFCPRVRNIEQWCEGMNA